jgi:RNA polymerase sigma-70 factor (ECF subfamily)
MPRKIQTLGDAMRDTARLANQTDFSELAEPFRHELQVHCYRMLGSLQDAEDLVQETFLRAWQKLDTYEGRASFRAWLYKIATNACLDALDRRPRRVVPQNHQPASDPTMPPAPPITEPIWLEPIPDELIADIEASPEARYDARESITLAFLTALQVLPARQRAVLILRDVLDMRAEQVAQLLDFTVSAVNSAVHRARVTLAKHYRSRGVESIKAKSSDDQMRDLLDRYMRAWEAADVDALVALLKQDATFTMPPSPSWYQGKVSIRTFLSGLVELLNARGRWRFVPIRANGQPAFAWYQREKIGEPYRAFAIQVIAFDGDLIADVVTFMKSDLFSGFGLSPELEK